jgi:non-canonical (house-cleaning) NTP pyrophosphatase
LQCYKFVNTILFVCLVIFQTCVDAAPLHTPFEIYPEFKQSPKLYHNAKAKFVTVVVASTKELKIKAAEKFFDNNRSFSHKRIEVIGVKADSGIAEQPIGLENGILGATNRIKNAKLLVTNKKQKLSKDTYYVAIENFFSQPTSEHNPTDHAVVVIEAPDGKQYIYLSQGVEVTTEIYEHVVNPENMTADGTGAKTTIGEYLASKNKVDAADWFHLFTTKDYNRQQQISSAFKYAG